jgi:hypothetical protein
MSDHELVSDFQEVFVPPDHLNPEALRLKFLNVCLIHCASPYIVRARTCGLHETMIQSVREALFPWSGEAPKQNFSVFNSIMIHHLPEII